MWRCPDASASAGRPRGAPQAALSPQAARPRPRAALPTPGRALPAPARLGPRLPRECPPGSRSPSRCRVCGGGPRPAWAGCEDPSAPRLLPSRHRAPAPPEPPAEMQPRGTDEGTPWAASTGCAGPRAVRFPNGPWKQARGGPAERSQLGGFCGPAGGSQALPSSARCPGASCFPGCGLRRFPRHRGKPPALGPFYLRAILLDMKSWAHVFSAS